MRLGFSEEEQCMRFFCFQLDPGQLRAALFDDATTPLAQELVPDTPPLTSIEAIL